MISRSQVFVNCALFVKDGVFMCSDEKSSVRFADICTAMATRAIESVNNM